VNVDDSPSNGLMFGAVTVAVATGGAADAFVARPMTTTVPATKATVATTRHTVVRRH
jgi:hypothetical protein